MVMVVDFLLTSASIPSEVCAAVRRHVKRSSSNQSVKLSRVTKSLAGDSVVGKHGVVCGVAGGVCSCLCRHVDLLLIHHVSIVMFVRMQLLIRS